MKEELKVVPPTAEEIEKMIPVVEDAFKKADVPHGEFTRTPGAGLIALAQVGAEKWRDFEAGLFEKRVAIIPIAPGVLAFATVR